MENLQTLLLLKHWINSTYNRVTEAARHLWGVVLIRQGHLEQATQGDLNQFFIISKDGVSTASPITYYNTKALPFLSSVFCLSQMQIGGSSDASGLEIAPQKWAQSICRTDFSKLKDFEEKWAGKWAVSSD